MNPESLARYWHSLGRARVVSVPGFLFVAVLLTFRGVVTGMSNNSNFVPQLAVAPASPDGARLAMATACAIAVGGMVLLIARHTVLRSRPVGPWVTLVIYVVFVIAMSSMAAYINQRSVLDIGEFLSRIVTGLLWVLVVSIVLDARDEQNEALFRLVNRRLRLERLQAEGEQTLADLSRRLHELVDRQIAPEVRSTISNLRQLQRPINSSGDLPTKSVPALAHQIRELGEHTVRELSHRLDEPTTETLMPAANDTPELVNSPKHADKLTRTKFRRLWVSATAARPFDALIVSISLTVTALPSLIGGLGARGWIGALIFVVCSYGCLHLADIFVTPHLGAMAVWRRVVVCLAVYVLTVGVSYTAESVLMNIAIPWRFAVAMLFGLILISIGWSLAAAVSAQRRRVLLDLAATVSAIEWETTQIENSVVAIRHAAARMLHGGIQGRLAAVALRLNMAAETSGTSGVNEAIDESVDVLVSVLDSLAAVTETHAEPTDLTAALIEIAASWDAVIGISFRLDGDTTARVAQHSLVPTVVDVVREATTNAARHGSARNVDVSIESEPNSIRIVVADDGVGVMDVPVQGLGLRSLARIGAMWELVAGEDGGSCLAVEIPLSRQPSSCTQPLR